MPRHVDRPSEATSLRELAKRVFNLERRLQTKQTDGLVGHPVSMVFAMSGLVLGISAPFPPPYRLQLTLVYARLRVASTSGAVTGHMLVDDGGPWGAFSIPAGQKVTEVTINNQVGPENWVTMRSTALGSGASGLTVRVDGYVLARS